MSAPTEDWAAHGVDALIARLRDEGVAAGRTEAAQLVEDAKAEAKRILDAAATEATAAREAARKEADAFRAAGEEALRVAMRDAVLDMKAGLLARFRDDVERLVSEEMVDRDLLRRMVLEIAGRARGDSGDGPLEVLLPQHVVGLETLRDDPAALAGGPLTQTALALTGDLLREGVTFGVAEDDAGGVRVKFMDGDVQLDLTDKAVASLILSHLQPRFRAILEGVIK